ncbi:MAG: PAC2 family protein [Halolamina sp.]
MDDIQVETLADPALSDPVFVEGLPGVGHVGKLAAEHLLEEFESQVVRRVYADEFPPQVSVDDDGVASLTCAEFHAVDLSSPTPTRATEDDDQDESDADETDEAESGPDPDPDSNDDVDPDAADAGDEEEEAEPPADPLAAFEPGERDLLVLTGDHQAQSNAGHYALTNAFLDVADDFGCETAYALGGVPTGELIEEYNVLGAVSDPELKPALSDAGVDFRAEEPAGGIVGVSGLVLGLGERRGIDAACLMGETSGYLVDPKSAKAVIEVLEARFEFAVDFESLEDRAEEMEEVVGKIQEMQGGGDVTEDELRYIG